MNLVPLAELLAASVLPLVLYVFVDGLAPCNDGHRYTSGRLQPSPFHRRLTRWNPRLLTYATLASFALSAWLLGDWKKALLFLSLPGVAFCATHPTTVDGPAIGLALVAADLHRRGMTALAMPVALLAGCVHERGIVFAALYAWSPWLLLPLPFLLIAWPHPAPADHDTLVGIPTLRKTIERHRPYSDLLDWQPLAWSLRGVLPLAVYFGTSLSGWASFALAFASRAISTDPGRCMIWAAPALILGMPDVPAWAVWLHVASFRRLP